MLKMKKLKLQDGDPTPERQRMGQIIQVETINAGVMTHIDIRSTLLDRYWQDQLLLGGGADLDLASARYNAGQRLQLLYESTGFRQRVTGRYSPPSIGHDDITDDEDRAISSYNIAVRKLTAVSPSVASAVVNLCIHDFDPVDRADLIRGLDVLIRHWGL